MLKPRMEAKQIGKSGIVFSLTGLPLLWVVNFLAVTALVLGAIGPRWLPDILLLMLQWLMVLGLWFLPAVAVCLLVGSIALLLGRPWAKPTCLVGLTASQIQSAFVGISMISMTIVSMLSGWPSFPWVLWSLALLAVLLAVIWRAAGRLAGQLRLVT